MLHSYMDHILCHIHDVHCKLTCTCTVSVIYVRNASKVQHAQCKKRGRIICTPHAVNVAARAATWAIAHGPGSSVLVPPLRVSYGLNGDGQGRPLGHACTMTVMECAMPGVEGGAPGSRSR